MEKKVNKFKTNAKKVWSFVKEHKAAFILGTTTAVATIGVASLYGKVKREASAADGLAAELDPNGEHGISSIYKDESTVSMLIKDIEANQIGDRVAMIFGKHGIDEHTPIDAIVEFDISNKN